MCDCWKAFAYLYIQSLAFQVPATGWTWGERMETNTRGTPTQEEARIPTIYHQGHPCLPGIRPHYNHHKVVRYLHNWSLWVKHLKGKYVSFKNNMLHSWSPSLLWKLWLFPSVWNLNGPGRCPVPQTCSALHFHPSFRRMCGTWSNEHQSLTRQVSLIKTSRDEWIERKGINLSCSGTKHCLK